jgi:hypothetical protein
MNSLALSPMRESENTQPSRLRFRVLLTEGNAPVFFYREAFDRIGRDLE